jgi:hypothetical protein
MPLAKSGCFDVARIAPKTGSAVYKTVALFPVFPISLGNNSIASKGRNALTNY